MNWLLSVIALLLLCLLGVSLWFLLLTRSFSRDVAAFFSSSDGKSPSPAAAVWDSMVARLVERAKVTLMGLASGRARADQAVMSEIVQQGAASQSPLLGAIMGVFPKSGRMLAKNPALLEWAVSRFSAAGSKPASKPQADGGNGFAGNATKYD